MKIANLNGWEVATDVARKTISKFEVTADDFISANLRAVKANKSPSRSVVMH